MGFVWNVMLSLDNEEFYEDDEVEPRETCEPLDRVNAWLVHGRLVSLVEATYADGAGMDANLYGGGFKHFDIDGFIEFVRSQSWKARSKVQLWVKGDEEGMGTEPWTLIRLGPHRREAAIKAAATRKRRAAGIKAAKTKQRRKAARKAAEARKAKDSKQLTTKLLK